MNEPNQFSTSPSRTKKDAEKAAEVPARGYTGGPTGPGTVDGRRTCPFERVLAAGVWVCCFTTRTRW